MKTSLESQLPPEMLALIFKHVPSTHLASVLMTCKRWHAIGQIDDRCALVEWLKTGIRSDSLGRLKAKPPKRLITTQTLPVLARIVPNLYKLNLTGNETMSGELLAQIPRSIEHLCLAKS